MNIQEKEIEIHPRTITVSLSDADCKTLMYKCGEHGITINDLSETFANYGG